MSFRGIAWLTGWLAVTQLIATSVHAADTAVPGKPDAPPGATQLPPPAAQPEADPWLSRGPTGPVVHLDAHNFPMELQLHTVDGWEPTCVAPCDQRVNRAGTYRVNGPGLRPSQPFSVPPGGTLHLEVTPGSAPRYWTGMGLTLGGLGTVAYGLVWYGLISSVSTSCSSQDSFCDTSNGVRDVGVGIMVVGGVVAVIGALLWSGNSTQVEMH
jgi:hypothetical protein